MMSLTSASTISLPVWYQKRLCCSSAQRGTSDRIERMRLWPFALLREQKITGSGGI